MRSGRGGDARANAISRLATSAVGAEPAAWPLLWRKLTGAGQTVQLRVKGRRQGNVCGPDEVDLHGYHGPGRASGGYPYRGSIIKLRHPPARIPASDIHGLRHSRRGAANVPRVDPVDILYVGACRYLEADWVMAPDMECRHGVYLGCGCSSEP